jgi:hypothetical protein
LSFGYVGWRWVGYAFFFPVHEITTSQKVFLLLGKFDFCVQWFYAAENQGFMWRYALSRIYVPV